MQDQMIGAFFIFALQKNHVIIHKNHQKNNMCIYEFLKFVLNT